MKRFAIICGAGIVSGKEIMVLELCGGLREQGHAVEVVTSFWSDGSFASRVRALGARVHVMRIGYIAAKLNWPCIRMTLHQLIFWPGLLLRYGPFLRATRPEKIVHTNWHHLLLLSPFLRTDRDLYWLHESVPNRPRYRRLFAFLSHRVMCFVVVSRSVAESLRAVGVKDDQIEVIHNGIADPARRLANHSAATGLIRLGIVGQVGPHKGHDDLLEAFSRLRSGGARVELHVFGSGAESYERHLKQRAASLGVNDFITWHGFVADRQFIYDQIDICVVPSRFAEPFGLSALEPGFFGLPVVTTRRGGLPEIVEDGESGFLVDAERPDQLAARLDVLVGDANLRSRMGAKGRERAAQHFSRSRFMHDFTTLLSKLGAALI